MLPRVLIADCHALSRQLLRQLVDGSEQFKTVTPVADIAAAVRICSERQVQMLIMDVSSPFGASGLQAAEKIKNDNFGGKIILTTALPDPLLLKLARSSAADALWYKDVQELPLPGLMSLVMTGKRVFPETPPEARLGLVKSTGLTVRELEVLHLVVSGCSDKAVGDHLKMSVSTVRYHVNNLLAKSGFSSRTELAVNAVGTGIAVPGIL